jgi:hypothetical protein
MGAKQGYKVMSGNARRLVKLLLGDKATRRHKCLFASGQIERCADDAARRLILGLSGKSNKQEGGV